MAFIEFRDVKKEYHEGGMPITAVRDCSFTVEKGELAVILGPSGAGKTTVLNLLGGMDRPSGGSILVDGRPIQPYTKKEQINYRRYAIGFVFQFYNLVANLTALENVELACQLCPDSLDPRAVLGEVGLADRMGNFPSQLSGGEQQRVAIARAVAKNPKLLLCDEPTGALDSATGQRIITLLQQTCRQRGTTTVLITHNAVLTEIADRVIRIKNGTVQDIACNSHPKRAEEIAW